ncbi:Uncharacterized protein Fot_32614 [Forsythia ovata]|uniref:Uncharacterized protein n=1 Tax=Forsythia ovata TaxID=205694 RepID=A0ABD1T8C2_9LAMI
MSFKNFRSGSKRFSSSSLIWTPKSGIFKSGPEGEAPHLCQRPLDQAGCKSRDVHEWQGPEGESQQINPHDRPPQYFSENLPRTGIEPALPDDFSLHHLRPYQLVYAPGG